MNKEQLEHLRGGLGFIAALDQSGGSTPKALELYGISPDDYEGEERMFDLIHEMRTRIMTSECFDKKRILAAILFEKTMESEICGQSVPAYLWHQRGILPFLKIDVGLADKNRKVRRLRPIPRLPERLARASELGIVGTKMRSVIDGNDRLGIAEIVDQQFDLADVIIRAGLVPIIEPEISINSPDKAECEAILSEEISRCLKNLSGDSKIVLKLTLPESPDHYLPFVHDKSVIRVSALSGGYDQMEACSRLARNHGVIASFSRALLDGLTVTMSDRQFNERLERSIDRIHSASFC